MVCRDRLCRLRLFRHRAGRTMELEKQGGRYFMIEARILVDRGHLNLVEQLDASNGHTALNRRDYCVYGTLYTWKCADRSRYRFWNSVKTHCQFGDDAERAFRSDKQPSQIVSRCRLSRPSRGSNNAAVGQHHRHRKHILTHRTVTHCIRSGGSRRSHPAERRIGSWVYWKEKPSITQVFIELLARDTRFDRGVEVFGVDLHNAAHVGHVDANPAGQRCHMPLEGGTYAEGNDRRPVLSAQLDNRRHLVGAVGKRDRVWRVWRVIGLILAVMRADCHRGGEPIPEKLAQRRDQ